MPARPPLVAITTCLDRGVKLRPGRDYVYVARAYAVALRRAGAMPIFVGPDADADALVERVDALVITGGDDLPRRVTDHALSGADASVARDPQAVFEVGARGQAEDVERIAHDRQLLGAFDLGQKPVLGVCYGMQLMNIHYGGSLLLDVRDERKSEALAVDHGGGNAVTRHVVMRARASQLLASFGPRWTVNSCHRQALDEVAEGFSVTAHSSDGVVEAFERNTLFGVQWHPETDPACAPMWRSFVAQCT